MRKRLTLITLVVPLAWLGSWVWSAPGPAAARRTAPPKKAAAPKAGKAASPAPAAKRPAAALAAAQQPAGAPSQYIGTEACLKCHIDLAKQQIESPHGKVLSMQGLPEGMAGCEACHGPGRAHSTSRAARKQIIAFYRLDTEKGNAICLKCHNTQEAEDAHKPYGGMNQTCYSCHDVHRTTGFTPMLRKAENAGCLDCHPKIASASPKEHHIILPGMSCSKCHEPHLHTLGVKVEDKRAACQECHSKGGISPASHREEGFMPQHGKLALADMKNCTTCHDEQKDCFSCHQVKMPHSEDYIPFGHIMEASFDNQAKCEKCHRPNLCSSCHVRGQEQAG